MISFARGLALRSWDKAEGASSCARRSLHHECTGTRRLCSGMNRAVNNWLCGPDDRWMNERAAIFLNILETMSRVNASGIGGIDYIRTSTRFPRASYFRYIDTIHSISVFDSIIRERPRYRSNNRESVTRYLWPQRSLNLTLPAVFIIKRASFVCMKICYSYGESLHGRNRFHCNALWTYINIPVVRSLS